MSISEDLKARVRKKFNELYSNDEKISKQWSAIQSGSATYEEAHAYGERLGDLIREALNEVTGEDLPGGSMAYDIADAVVGDQLRLADQYMLEGCKAIQSGMNKTARVGIRPIEPPSREDVIREVVGKVAAVSEYSPESLDGIIDFATWNLETASKYMQVNADFLTRAGCDMLIMRTYEGPHWDPHRGKGGSIQDCKFCKERATNGWQEYRGSAEQEIYRRHRGCRCMVVTKFGDKMNTAWTGAVGNSMRELYAKESARLRKLDAENYRKEYERLKEARRRT